MSFSERVKEIISANSADLNGRNSLRATVELLGSEIVNYIAGEREYKRLYDDVIDWEIGSGNTSIGVKITPLNEEISSLSKYEMNKLIGKCLAADVSLVVITNGIEVVIVAEHLYYENGMKFISTIDDEDNSDSLMSHIANGKYNEEEFVEYYKYNINTDSVVDLLDIAKHELVGRIEEAKNLIAHLRNGGNTTSDKSGNIFEDNDAGSDEDETEDDGEDHTESDESAESSFDEFETSDDVEDNDIASDEEDGFDDENVDELGTVMHSDDENETEDDAFDAQDEAKDNNKEDVDKDAISDVENMLDEIADEATEYREITLENYKNHLENGITIDKINAMKFDGRKPFVMREQYELAGQTAECVEGLLSLVHISKDANLNASEFERHEKVNKAGFSDISLNVTSIDTTPYSISNDIDIEEALDIIKFAAEALEFELDKVVLTVHVTEAFADCPSVPQIVADDEEDELDFMERLNVIEVDKDIIRRIPARKPCVEYLEGIVKRVISIKFGSITNRMIESQSDKAQSVWDIIVNSQGGEENAVLPKRPFKIFGSNKKIISDILGEVRDKHEVIEINGIDYYVSHMNDFEYLFAISSIVNGIIGKSSEVLKINTEIDSGLLEALRGYESTDAREALLLRRVVGYFTDLENQAE